MSKASDARLSDLATWLHTAAADSGQLDSMRTLIRSAMTAASEFYGLPADDEPDREIDPPTVIAKFAAMWDEHDRFLRDAQ